MGLDGRLTDLTAETVAHILSHLAEGQLGLIALQEVEKDAAHEHLKRGVGVYEERTVADRLSGKASFTSPHAHVSLHAGSVTG